MTRTNNSKTLITLPRFYGTPYGFERDNSFVFKTEIKEWIQGRSVKSKIKRTEDKKRKR